MELGLQLCLIQRIRWIFIHLHLRMEWEQRGPGQHGSDQVISVKGWEVNGHRLGICNFQKIEKLNVYSQNLY